MQTDPEVMPEAVEYFRYYFLGALAMVMYNICRSVMNALGDSRRPLYYLIFSSVLKCGVGSFIYRSVSSGCLGCCHGNGDFAGSERGAFVWYIYYERAIFLLLNGKKIRFHKAMLSEIIRYGFPSGVQNSVIGFANVIVQSQINSFGKLAMAAYGTHAKIEGFAFLPITSFNMASTTFISQNLGAKQYDRAKKGARFSIYAAVILAEITGIFYYIFCGADDWFI